MSEPNGMAEGNVVIVIGQRGWVWIGKVTREDRYVVIRNAMNIRRWGTTEGLGQLAHGPTSETVLNKSGTVRLHPMQIVGEIEVDQNAWAGKLDGA